MEQAEKDSNGPEEETCAECGEVLIADPDGSPGVFVHEIRELDNECDPIPESLYGIF